MNDRELSDAELEMVTGGMAKVATKATLGEIRPKAPLLRAVMSPVRSLTPKSAPTRTCSGGVCNV
jgi:hypothetical protein